MPVPPTAWPPLHRLPIALLVVLAGCRSAAAPTPAPPPPAPPPPAQAPVVTDVVEETRRVEEALETVEIETTPDEATIPAEDPCPPAPIDPPEPPPVGNQRRHADGPDESDDSRLPPRTGTGRSADDGAATRAPRIRAGSVRGAGRNEDLSA